MMADPLELLGRFVHPDSLVFDIGANVGQHSSWFLQLGARVIAVEPCPETAARIPSHERLTVIEMALSHHEGAAMMYVSPGYDYLNSIEPGYPTDIQAHADCPFSPEPIRVKTMTLDSLVAWYGIPDFCKIDVEGHERAVLAGLSTALPALSFEVHDFAPEKADDCIAILASLGDYDLFYSPRESFTACEWPTTLDAFGDIYATRRTT